MPRFCTSCGAEVAESAVFCPACGKSVPAGASATTPGSPATAPGPAVSTTGAGLSDNVAGLLAYLLIPAIIFLFVEPYNRNKFVRFHSFQSIFYEVAWIVINVALNIVLPFVLWPLHTLVSLLFFAGWVIMAVKAYQGEMLKLPIIGDLAEKQANG
jgi:uncharacterized membrane protein